MKLQQRTNLHRLLALPFIFLLSSASFAQSPTQILGTGQILQDYQRYLQEPGHKAFATSPNGFYAWVNDRSQLESAIRDVLNLCNSRRKTQSEPRCVIADINGQLFGLYSEAETHLFTHSAVEAYEGAYSRSQHPKVFVQSPSGRWSWRGNRNSLAQAEREALEACNEGLSEGQEPCVVINRNGQFVNPF